MLDANIMLRLLQVCTDTSQTQATTTNQLQQPILMVQIVCCCIKLTNEDGKMR